MKLSEEKSPSAGGDTFGANGQTSSLGLLCWSSGIWAEGCTDRAAAVASKLNNAAETRILPIEDTDSVVLTTHGLNAKGIALFSMMS
jgi:hypothetical protein